MGIGPSNNFRIGFTKDHFEFMKLLSHVAAVTRYNVIWLDAQVKLNQNKRLKQQLSIFGIVAASVVLNYNLK